MTSLRLLRPVRAPLIIAIALQVLAAMLALLPLIALISFTATWLEHQRLPSTDLVVAAVVGTVGSALAGALATWVSHRADAQLTWRLQRDLATAIRHAPLPHVTGAGAARIRKVVQEDTGALHYLVAHTLLDATLLIVTPIVGFAALATIDGRIAILSLLPAVLGVRWFVLAMRGSGAQFADYAAWQQRIHSTVVDYVHGLPVAKIYGGPRSAEARYDEAVDGFHRFFRAWSGATARVTTASWLVVTAGVTAALFALVGGAGFIWGWVSAEALIAGVLLGPTVSAPIAVAGPRIQAIRGGLSALHSITEFLGRPRLDWGDSMPPPGARPALENATVRYDDTVALDDVSLQLPDRGVIAVVGASGSGKSTLALLIARFLDPDAGRLLLGNVDYRDVAEDGLYERVGFVFQDTRLPHGSIRDTLTAGRPIPEKRLREAARATAIHDTIVALPRGYDTALGDDTELSGGQRQRIALARALLRGHELLVLDEPFSALDPANRSSVLHTLQEQARDRTVLIIAHQLHLTRTSDRILVLDEGRLTGDGTHEELLRGCAPYRELWEAGARPDHDASADDPTHSNRIHSDERGR